IGKEHTFEKDTRDPEIIFGTFDKIIKNVWEDLIENKFSFKTITVICRFRGFETHTKARTLKEPTNNFKILRAEAKKLLLKFLVENPKLIRLIGLRLSQLRERCG
ncbi:MAG: DNA polymerase IV, partial [Patescibacteria group bacterium]|nr:DNA polymerase IV [Patescibacteria group bacterium]